MTKLWGAGLAVGMLLTAACVEFDAQHKAYLRQAEGKATQSEVGERLGRPQKSYPTPGGGTAWIYEVYQWQPGNRAAAPGTWCDEYELVFGNDTVLQTWTHHTYFHGGEAMPRDCRS